MRMKCRAKMDGKVGWVTVVGNTGTARKPNCSNFSCLLIRWCWVCGWHLSELKQTGLLEAVSHLHSADFISYFISYCHFTRSINRFLNYIFKRLTWSLTPCHFKKWQSSNSPFVPRWLFASGRLISFIQSPIVLQKRADGVDSNEDPTQVYLAVHWDEAIFILWRSLTETPRIFRDWPKQVKQWQNTSGLSNSFLGLSNQPVFWSTEVRWPCVRQSLESGISWLPSFPWVGSFWWASWFVAGFFWWFLMGWMDQMKPSKLFCPHVQVESEWVQIASSFNVHWDRPLKGLPFVSAIGLQARWCAWRNVAWSLKSRIFFGRPSFFFGDSFTHGVFEGSRSHEGSKGESEKKTCHHCDSRSQLEWDLAADFQVLAWPVSMS